MTRRFRLISVAGLCACAAGVMLAATGARAYDAEYVFGDSLSDNGNAAETSNDPYPYPPSYHYAYTNGPVAVAVLAQSLGLPALEPSLWATNFQDINHLFPAGFTPGTNYAFAGATANKVGYADFLWNLPQQVSAYTAHVNNVADPSALYVIMIGGNDVINAVTDPKQTGPADTYLMDSVTSEVDQITTLAADGARNFLVVNVPNVGLIPLLAGTAGAAPATDLSLLYDATLQTQLDDLALPAGDALHEFNLYAYNTAILENSGSYGFTNTKDPCYSNAPATDTSKSGCSLSNIDSFIYWNDVHPTGAVQALWAKGMEQAVPEPSIWAMLIIGFAGMGLMGLRTTRRGRAA
jgi:phospholipase/lecithinase/hemolysin